MHRFLATLPDRKHGPSLKQPIKEIYHCNVWSFVIICVKVPQRTRRWSGNLSSVVTQQRFSLSDLTFVVYWKTDFCPLPFSLSPNQGLSSILTPLPSSWRPLPLGPRAPDPEPSGTVVVRRRVPEQLTCLFDDEGQPLLNASLLGFLLMDPLHSSPEVDRRGITEVGPVLERASLEAGLECGEGPAPSLWGIAGLRAFVLRWAESRTHCPQGLVLRVPTSTVWTPEGASVRPPSEEAMLWTWGVSQESAGE